MGSRTELMKGALALPLISDRGDILHEDEENALHIGVAIRMGKERPGECQEGDKKGELTS